MEQKKYWGYCNGRCKLQIKEFNKENCLGGSHRLAQKQNTTVKTKDMIFFYFQSERKNDPVKYTYLCWAQGQGILLHSDLHVVISSRRVTQHRLKSGSWKNGKRLISPWSTYVDFYYKLNFNFLLKLILKDFELKWENINVTHYEGEGEGAKVFICLKIYIFGDKVWY